MTVYALLPDAKIPFHTSSGNLANGYLLFIYNAGTTVKATTYTDSTGLSMNTNPIVMNSRGETPYGVYVNSGQYKLVLAPSTDTDPPGSPIWSQDGITPANDISVADATEWTALAITPTYISAVSFSVSGNQTSVLQVGRRVKTTNSGGTVYSTISGSSFGAGITTVTVVNDSGTLDAGLSAVYYGLLSFTNPSFPLYMAHPLVKNTFSASASSIFTLDTTRYSAFLIRFLDVTPATDGVDLRIAIGTGGAFDAGTNYRWVRNDTGNGGANTVTSGTAGAFAIGALVVSNQVQRKISGTLFLTALADYPRFNWDLSYGSTTETMIRAVGAGQDNIAAARDQIRFLFSSGDIAGGSMTLYGFPI